MSRSKAKKGEKDCTMRGSSSGRKRSKRLGLPPAGTVPDPIDPRFAPLLEKYKPNCFPLETMSHSQRGRLGGLVRKQRKQQQLEELKGGEENSFRLEKKGTKASIKAEETSYKPLAAEYCSETLPTSLDSSYISFEVPSSQL